MECEKQRAVIVSGAPDPDLGFLKLNITSDDFIIAVDAGLKACLDVGLKPDLAVGDFDTYQPKGETQNMVVLPAEKDWPDTYAACLEAVTRGFKDVKLFCAVGSRIDHTYANFLSLYYLFQNGVKATLENAENIAFFTNKNIEILKSDKYYLSFFAFPNTVEGLTLRGVKYPLTNHTLKSESVLCVSNEIVEEKATVSLKKGSLLVLLTND